MARLSIFIGIGLGLVGTFGYFLASEKSVTAFFPLLVGVLMFLAGLICLTNYNFRRPMLQLSTAFSVFLLMASGWRLPFALVGASKDVVPAIALLDVIVLSGLFLFFGLRELYEARESAKYAKMAEEGKKMKEKFSQEV